MINKKTIITFLVHLRQGEHKKLTKQAMHPHREWAIGLLLFFCVLSIGGVYSAYLFTTYRDLHLTISGEADALLTYKENTVAKALKKYSDKQATFTALLSQQGTVAPAAPVVSQEEPAVATSTPNDLASPEVVPEMAEEPEPSNDAIILE